MSLLSSSQDGAKGRTDRSAEAGQVGIKDEQKDESAEKDEYPVKPYVHSNPPRDRPRMAARKRIIRVFIENSLYDRVFIESMSSHSKDIETSGMAP